MHAPAGSIRISAARVRNLQIDQLTLPRRALTVLTGPSGSGKSALLFDVLHAEAERRQALLGGDLRLRRPAAATVSGLPFALGFRPETVRGARARLLSMLGAYEATALLWLHGGLAHCLHCATALPISNSTAAIINAAQHFGADTEVDVLSPINFQANEFSALRARLLGAGYAKAFLDGQRVELSALAAEDFLPGPLDLWLDRVRLNVTEPARLREAVELAFGISGGRAQLCGSEVLEFCARPYCSTCAEFQAPISSADFSFYRQADNLPTAIARGRRLAGLSFAEFWDFDVAAALDWSRAALNTMTLSPLLMRALADLQRRLSLLVELGLSYLELSRPAQTLSTGEAYRVKLARQLGGDFSGVLYLLDEPTAGLSMGDVRQLVTVLGQFVAQGNTLVAVDQHPAVIQAAAQVVEFEMLSSPDSGQRLGRVRYVGPPSDLPAARVKLHRARRSPREFLEFSGLSAHNVQISQLCLPLGVLVCICGVSGSGKTTLVQNCLIPELRARKTQRICDATELQVRGSELSLVANALGIWTPLRELLAKTPAARARGYTPATFSLRSPKSRCPECAGRGELPGVAGEEEAWRLCSSCQGSGLKAELLDISYRGLELAKLFQLTLKEAAALFEPLPKISTALRWALRLGLEHLRLGERSVAISAGERQRAALAAQFGGALSKTGFTFDGLLPETIFFFDEPTLGLAPREIADFVSVCDELLAAGHSVVLIEHQPELIAVADYQIEIGPGAGPAGGKLLRAAIT